MSISVNIAKSSKVWNWTGYVWKYVCDIEIKM